MLGAFDYALWGIAFLAEACVIFCALRNRDFLRYLTLNLFVVGTGLIEVLDFVVLKRYGFKSAQYIYCYYYTDALLTVAMFVAIIGLYLHIFRDGNTAKHVRLLAVVALSTTVAYSFLVVEMKRQLLATKFVTEFSQNLYFVGIVLTYVLWTILFKRREARTRLILIVTAFGIFFSAQAIIYCFHGFFPSVSLWRYFPALVGLWLPVSLAYTFARFPEEARISIRQLERAS